jgi:hypothetical protein
MRVWHEWRYSWPSISVFIIWVGEVLRDTGEKLLSDNRKSSSGIAENHVKCQEIAEYHLDVNHLELEMWRRVYRSF